MVLWLFVIFVVVGIIMIILGNMSWSDPYYNRKRNDDKEKDKFSLKNKILEFFYYYDENICFAGWIVSIIAGIVLLIMVISIIDVHSGLNGDIAKMNERYKALSFKAESDFARDELGLLNKEIVDEIQNWNEDIVYRREMQDNFWVGVFYPDIYYDFKTIDLNKLNK